MFGRDLRRRLALAGAVAVGVLVAFQSGAMLLAMMVGRSSTTNAGVPTSVLSDAFVHGLAFAIVTGACAAGLYRPAADEGPA
jgi:hypothetical protein